MSKSIVIVNEFTVKDSSGKGSRGSSPGDYVMKYMARDGATEVLTPVRRTEQEAMAFRHDARRQAAAEAHDEADMQESFARIQGRGGIAFNGQSVSLSDEGLRQSSKQMQQMFDDGKTVMKTVISFEEDYLKEMKLLPEDFAFRQPGDYKGQVDQMKLRLGIMNSVDKLGRDYDDLQYVGVIHVNTEHVHCHLAMADAGEGRLTEDGQQKGKLSKRQKDALVRNLDMYLDENKEMAYLPPNYAYDRRNERCLAEQMKARELEQKSASQILLACLPDDRRKWNAASEDKDMQRANAFARDYVRDYFTRPESGYETIAKQIQQRADMVSEQEQLTPKQHRKLVEDGHRQAEDDCINDIYRKLMLINKNECTVQTPFLAAAALDDEDIGKDADDVQEFGFRMRTYSARLSYHREEYQHAHSYVKQYEAGRETGSVSADAEPVYQFFKFEEEYQNACMAKYQYFLGGFSSYEEYEEEMNVLKDYQRRTEAVAAMYEDKDIRDYRQAEAAEEYGQTVYHVSGGRYMPYDEDIIEQRRDKMQATLREKTEAFQERLHGYGLVMTEDGSIQNETIRNFDDVKMMDMHHMGLDSSEDMAVDASCVEKFAETAETRQALAEKAREYLRLTGQQHAEDELPNTDIRRMVRYAEELKQTHCIRSQREELTEQQEQTKAMPLDKSFDIRSAIEQTMQERQYAYAGVQQADDGYDFY